MDAELRLPEHVWRNLLAHLLPPASLFEEAAFVFASTRTEEGATIFDFLDCLRVPAEGFLERSPYFLELRDETRAAVIKQAHDLRASVVEFHSHPTQRHAQFSFSDLTGLHDFVPHVWWRLKGRPYAAIVVSPTGIDALTWLTDPKTCRGLQGIRTESQLIEPTGLSMTEWSVNDERGSV